MSNQPPPSRPWLRLAPIARPAAPPSPTPAPPQLTAAPPPVIPPLLALPTFVRPAAPEPTPRPPPPAPTPSTLPGITPTPEPQPQQLQPPILFPQQPVAPPTANITPLPPAPIVETSAPPSSTMVAPPISTTASVPSTPILKTFAPSASLPASPAKKLSPLPPPPPTVSPHRDKLSSPARAPPSVLAPISDTKPSPKIIKPEAETPPRSPVLKPVAPPPSPLKLPPQQIKSQDEDVPPRIPLEAEQKNILFQKSIAVPERANGNREMIRSVGPQNPGTAAATLKGANEVVASTGTGNGMAKKKVESGAVGLKVITITGENRGATMELSRSAKNQCYKIGNNARESSSSSSGSSSSSEEGKNGRENQGHKGKAPATASLPTTTYMNSNVQGVNNSILYNSSCTHHDPGVHLYLTRKPAVGVFPRMKEHKA